MSGYAMGLADNMKISLILILVSLACGTFDLYKGIRNHTVILMVFGGIGIGMGFLQWMIGFSLAIPGSCFAVAGLLLTLKSKTEGV